MQIGFDMDTELTSNGAVYHPPGGHPEPTFVVGVVVLYYGIAVRL